MKYLKLILLELSFFIQDDKLMIVHPNYHLNRYLHKTLLYEIEDDTLKLYKELESAYPIKSETILYKFIT
jgi:hypothetical protein